MTSTRKAVISLIVVFLLLRSFALFAFGKKEERPIEARVITDLQDRYDALTAPGIIMLPPSGTSAVSQELLLEIEKELYKQLVNTGKLKPVKMQHWLFTAFTNKADDPFSVMNVIKAERYTIPLRFIGKPAVFRSGSQYFFTFCVYSLEAYYPTIIFRQIASLNSIEELIASCVEELHIRLTQPASNIKKRVVIDEFKIDYFRLVEHSSGEFDFISAPFLEEDGMTLREADDFFSRVMGYILTTTNLFQVFQISDFREYSNSIISTTSPLVDYKIQGRVQLSEDECVLYVDVIDVHASSMVLSLRQPLLSYSYDGIWNTYRLISLQIIEELFDSESYGIIPFLESQGRSFFTNNMFVGRDRLDNFVLPRGLHIISTGYEYQAAEKGNAKSGRKLIWPLNKSQFNSYYVLLDNRSVVYTNMRGKHIWNLLNK